jgi:hypothetical protein
MTVVNAPDFVSFSELPLLHSLTTQDRRPNLLIVCSVQWVDAAVDRLQTVCAAPVSVVRLPGTLALPDRLTGTLVLHDVAHLTVQQQMRLFDWMGGHRDVQVISMTGAALASLVHDGRFLEGLFYRLNTVCVVAPSDAFVDCGTGSSNRGAQSHPAR